ncbi:hypothetical protein AAEX28_13785 [Lentisphaerota bacterium WC36G]|nr:hypothetical protein LJT99_00535 [Lentisphaerae bacterium WC36]
MLKKIEVFGVVILVLIGLVWGGVEIYLRCFANKIKLEMQASVRFERKEFFYSSMLARCAFKAKNEHAVLLICLSELMRRNPNSAEYWLGKCKVSSFSKEVKQGINLMILMQQKKYKEACEFFNKLPAKSKSRLYKVACSELVMSGKYNFKEDVKTFQSYADEGHKDAHATLACLYLLTLNTPMAEKYLLICAYNGDEWAVAELANYYEKHEKKDKVIELFQEFANKDVKYNYELGTIFKKNHQYGKALECFEKYRKINRRIAFNKIFETYKDMKKYSEGIKYFTKIYETGDKLVIYRIALLYMYDKKYNEAIIWLKKISKENPKNEHIKDLLTECYDKTTNKSVLKELARNRK